MTSVVVAEIKGFDRHPRGYVVFTIEVAFQGSSWNIKKRFNDFVTLHQGLSREFRAADLGALPKKRFFGRFERSFLEERHRDLQAYLTNVLSKIPVTTSGATLEFLEVKRRVDIVPPPPDGGKEKEEYERWQEIEQRRLAALVDEFANAMIDSSSVGVEARGDAEVESQREKLLRACNGFSAHDEHLRLFFNGPVPGGLDGDTPDEVLDEMNNLPTVSVKNQLRTTNVGMEGLLAPVIMDNGQSLVCQL